MLSTLEIISVFDIICRAIIPQHRRGIARIQPRLVWLFSSIPSKEVEVHLGYMMCRRLYVWAHLFSPTGYAPALSLSLMLWCHRCPAKVYFLVEEACLLRVGAQLENFVESLWCFSGFSLPSLNTSGSWGWRMLFWDWGSLCSASFSSCLSRSETPRTQQYHQH